ncbi:MAG: response regulator [Halofilum sp. (in: g-proteobacteria)]|nr:response regulator [Halofilum sp. (in: g-proteobacteria)]
MSANVDRQTALQVNRILRSQATTYAMAGTLIAVAAVILGTLLVSVQVYDGITLENIKRAHRENIAIWALDAMPFLFGLWGQVASLRMARHAGTLLESSTSTLREELEEAHYTARNKTDFFARMSHELRTPLNAILGMSEMLGDTEDPDKRRDRARVIHDSAESLLTLINDVLDMSRIEAGQIEIDSVDFDLRSHLNGAAHLLEGQAVAKGLRLISLVPPDAPRRVVGDPGRLRQVLVNLIGNAIKFTERGEIVLSLRRWTRADDGYRLSIEVADTGVGIARKDLERLFEPYQQADEHHGGTGLGLSITRELIQAMGGEIEVDSTPGRGSAFSFTVHVGLSAAPQDAGQPAVDLHGKRVLLADGDAHARAALGGQLEALGLRVTPVGDGVEAMQEALRAAVREQPYQLLLADMFLPHLSGEDLGRRLIERPETRNCCMAVMTTAGARGDAKRLNEAGFAGYLRKPLPPAHLQELVQAILATGSMSADERRRQGLVTRFTVSGASPVLDPVLVVDDSSVNREIALEQLARIDLDAESSDSGEAAFEALARRRFGVILLDAHLGDGTAEDFIRRLRSSADGHAGIPVVVFSAGLTDAERAGCEQAGADGFLDKPVSAEQLRAALLPQLEADTTDDGRDAESAPGPEEEGVEDRTVTPTLARLFLQETESRIEAILSAAAEEPPGNDKIANEAHGIKGASQHLPAANFTGSASRLEQAALAGEEQEVRAAIEDLLSRWKSLRREIDRLAGGTAE